MGRHSPLRHPGLAHALVKPLALSEEGCIIAPHDGAEAGNGEARIGCKASLDGGLRIRELAEVRQGPAYASIGRTAPARGAGVDGSKRRSVIIFFASFSHGRMLALTRRRHSLPIVPLVSKSSCSTRIFVRVSFPARLFIGALHCNWNERRVGGAFGVRHACRRSSSFGPPRFGDSVHGPRFAIQFVTAQMADAGGAATRVPS